MIPMRIGLALTEGAQGAAVIHAGVASRLHKGELCGAVSNLKTLCGIASPVLWAEVYGCVYN